MAREDQQKETYVVSTKDNNRHILSPAMLVLNSHAQ